MKGFTSSEDVMEPNPDNKSTPTTNIITDANENGLEDDIWGDFQDASSSTSIANDIDQSAQISKYDPKGAAKVKIDSKELSSKVKTQVQIIATDLSTWTGSITQSITCCADSNLPPVTMNATATAGDFFYRNNESLVDELSTYSTISPLSSSTSVLSHDKSFFGKEDESSSKKDLEQCETFSTSASTASMGADDEVTVKASNRRSRSPLSLANMSVDTSSKTSGRKNQVKQGTPAKESSKTKVKSPLRSNKSSQKTTPKRSGKFSRGNNSMLSQSTKLFQPMASRSTSQPNSNAIVMELISDEEQGLLNPPTPSSVQAQAPVPNYSSSNSVYSEDSMTINTSSSMDSSNPPQPPRVARMQTKHLDIDSAVTMPTAKEKHKKQRNVYRKQSNKIKKIINQTGKDDLRTNNHHSGNAGFDNFASLALSSTLTNDNVTRWLSSDTSSSSNSSLFSMASKKMKKKEKMQLLHENVLVGAPKTIKDDSALIRRGSSLSAGSGICANSVTSQDSGSSETSSVKKKFSERIGLQRRNSNSTSTEAGDPSLAETKMESSTTKDNRAKHRRIQSFDDVNIHLSGHHSPQKEIPLFRTLSEIRAPRSPPKSSTRTPSRRSKSNSKAARAGIVDMTKGSGMVDITNSPNVSENNHQSNLFSMPSGNTRSKNRSPKKSSSKKKGDAKKVSSTRESSKKEHAMLDDSIRGRLDGFDVLSLGQARNISYIGSKQKRFAGQRYTLRSMVSDMLWASGGREPPEVILEGFSRFGEDRWSVTLNQSVSYSSTYRQLHSTWTKKDSVDENPNLANLIWGKDNRPPPPADSPRSRKSNDINAATLSCPVDIDDEIFVIKNDDQLKSAFDLAVAPMKNADFRRSVELFQKILKGLLVRYSKTNGRHYLIGATHHSLGVLKMWEGNFEEAISSFEDAISARTSILSLYHPSVAVSYSKMGLTYFALEQLDKALESFQKALDIRNKLQKRDQLEVAKIYNNMGCVYYQKGDKLAALNLFIDALQIQRRFFQPIKRESLIHDTSITLGNMGKIYVEQNDFDMSFFLFEEALMLQTQSFTRNHSAILTSMGNIAFVKAKKGEARNALQVYQSIHRAQVGKYGNLSDEATETNGLMSLIYIQQQQFDSAEACLLDVLEWQKANLDEHHFARKNTELTIEKCRQAQYDMNLKHVSSA